MKIFMEVYENIPRQGPGDNEFTRRAYELIKMHNKSPQILDIGCGKGVQSRELARISGGHVTAIDNHAPFLQSLKHEAEKEGVWGKMATVVASMEELPFTDQSFDVVWSEGAAYIMGIEKALKTWRRLLKPKGYIVLSEAVWLTDNPPAEAYAFWQSEYLAIMNVEDNIALMRKSGYDVLAHFTLPSFAWWQNYYQPALEQVTKMRQKYSGNSEAEEIFSAIEHEAEIYRLYGESYSYEFFVLQNTL